MFTNVDMARRRNRRRNSVIQSLLSSTPESPSVTIAVDIKAKKRLHHNFDSDCQVFYVRVSSSEELDLPKCFNDAALRRLGELLLCMQRGEQDGHLSVQRSGDVDTPGCVQEVFWLDRAPGCAVQLSCQHSTHVASLDTAEMPPFVVHFRVIQTESHIVSEGHRIHKYLHKIKLLNEKVELSFSMKVCGAVCQTDFRDVHLVFLPSVKKYLPVKGVSIADDIQYFFGKGCLRSMWCGTVKAFAGRSVNVSPPMNDESPALTNQLSVSTVACLYPLVDRFPQTTSSPGVPGHIVINLYGPELTALALTDRHYEQVDVGSLLAWEQFSLRLKDASAVLHGDLIVGATLTSLRYLPPWVSDCTSFLLCVGVIVEDTTALYSSDRNQEIINCLQDNQESLEWLSKPIGDSMTSCLEKIFVHRETEYEKMYRETYAQCTEMITASVFDVFNHSTHTQFRVRMMGLLKADSKEEMRLNLKKSLKEVAKISDEQAEKEFDKLDEWDEESVQDTSSTHPPGASQGSGSLSQGPLSQPTPQRTSHSQHESEVVIQDREVLEEMEELIHFALDNTGPGTQDQNVAHRLPVSGVQGARGVQVPELLSEEELDFFPDEPEFDDHHNPAASGLRERVDQDASPDAVPEGNTRSLQSVSQCGGPHTPMGDEWLSELMLDVSDWV